MNQEKTHTYSVFDGFERVFHGGLEEVVQSIKKKYKYSTSSPLQIWSDLTGKEMDIDLRGSEKEVLNRLAMYRSIPQTQEGHGGPGRPKLGVVNREVALLPRHWEWLANQNGGASAVLRRLVDEARKKSTGEALVKEAQTRTYGFMSAIAGNFPRYEEALRALYAGDLNRLKTQIRDWPRDIKDHVLRLSKEAFPA